MVSGSPYLLSEPPTSPGRILLSRGFAHWCALHEGFGPGDIASHFAKDEGEDATAEDELVRANVRIFGELLAGGILRAVARPIGGGPASDLAPEIWELDDFSSRMAQSALNLEEPYDPRAKASHWIFLEAEGLNRVLEKSIGTDADAPKIAETREARARVEHGTKNESTTSRLLRLPEVKSITGLSASTIYRRIASGNFPAQVKLGSSRVSAWREEDITRWVNSIC